MNIDNDNDNYCVCLYWLYTLLCKWSLSIPLIHFVMSLLFFFFFKLHLLFYWFDWFDFWGILCLWWLFSANFSPELCSTTNMTTFFCSIWFLLLVFRCFFFFFFFTKLDDDVWTMQIENLEDLLKEKDNQVDMARARMTAMQAHHCSSEGQNLIHLHSIQ